MPKKIKTGKKRLTRDERVEMAQTGKKSKERQLRFRQSTDGQN